jgi:hypothetical protein
LFAACGLERPFIDDSGVQRLIQAYIPLTGARADAPLALCRKKETHVEKTLVAIASHVETLPLSEQFLN